MTFRELYDRYRAGTATPEERRIVDEELEKATILNDHLFGTWEETAEPAPAAEFKEVKRSLRKRNAALVLTSVVLVFALLMTIPLVENVYFDPMQGTWSEERTDLEIALECYYNLFAPRQFFLGVESITDTGFASWALELSFMDNDSLGTGNYLTATVSKNDIHFPRGTLYYTPTNMFDMAPLRPQGDHWVESAMHSIERQFRNVDEEAHVYGAVSFVEDLTAEQLFDLWLDYGAAIQWAGVRVGRPADPPQPLIGVHLEYGRQDCGVNAAYPELEVGLPTYANLEQHFRSMVEYCRDYERGTMNIGVVADPAYYDQVLEELDENGMRFFGCFMSAQPEVYYQLVEDGYITDFYALEVWDDFTYAYDAPSFGG